MPGRWPNRPIPSTRGVQDRTPDIGNRFALVDRVEIPHLVTLRDTLGDRRCAPGAEIAFFAEDNKARLRSAIIAAVHARTGISASSGDFEQLETVMRTVYSQAGTRSGRCGTSQLQTLNTRVIEYAVPLVAGAAEAQANYIRDITKSFDPIARPMYTARDNKELEFKSWF